MNVNHVAFATSTSLSVGTGLAVFAAATTASTVVAIAATIFAVTLGATTISSVTAWLASRDDTTAAEYFETVKQHAGRAVAGAYVFVSQTLLTALIQGVAEGIKNLVSRKIGGEDQTIRIVHQHN